MSATHAITPDTPPVVFRCDSCASSLAHDQRYCVECGARRGPLPGAVADLLGAMLERGHTHQGPNAVAATRAPECEHGASRAVGIASAHPRAAAAAILSMLGFGVILGSFANADIQSLARSVIVAVSPAPAAAPASSAADIGSSSPDSGPSSSGGSSSAAPATAGSAPTQASTTPTGGSPGGGGGSPPAAGTGLPTIKHVFLIVLSDQGLNQTFGLASHDQYLSKTLPAQGELVHNYYAVAHGALANEIALVSGQGPTAETEANCPQFTALTPGTKAADGQVSGSGCVYPLGVLTLGDELVANGQTWKAYVQGVGNVPPGQPATCRHPQLGAGDTEQVPRPGDPYVTWRNPFVYFSGIITTGACNGSDVDLEQLATDLQAESKTPTFSYIVPEPVRRRHRPAVCRRRQGRHDRARRLPPGDRAADRTVGRIQGSRPDRDHIR